MSCEVQLREAEADNDRFKDDNHRQNALIHTLKQRVEELQTVSVSNGEHALNSLQQDARQQQERIFELESRIRNLTDEREEAEQKTQSWQRKFGEITLHLQRTMSVEEEEPETLVEKVWQSYHGYITVYHVNIDTPARLVCLSSQELCMCADYYTMLVNDYKHLMLLGQLQHCHNGC